MHPLWARGRDGPAMTRQRRLRQLDTHQLQEALSEAVVGFLVAPTMEDTLAALRPLEAAQGEYDRRAARAGVVPACVCEECFRGFELPG